MFSSKMVSGAAAVFLGFGLASTSIVAKASKGPADAVAVCMAVARDDSSEVVRLLAKYKAPFEYSYSNLAPNRSDLRDARQAYECNGLSLDEFAQRVGADKTAVLLKHGQLVDDNYVAGAREAKADPNS